MTIGLRIKSLRDMLNLSMQAFGDKIKMTSSNISKMEKDLRIVTDRTITLICSEFSVNEEWLRTGEGEMFKSLTDDEKFAELLGELLVDENEQIREIIMKAVELDEDYLAMLNQLIEGMLNKQLKK
ncbi:helix-turn-helix domain-containing protein [Lysinibacillus fusiformis]|uniref:helix-turn-helix domain-containing protein n=1 Tax=Lysinibacillus fusiformis TaxID=28031 RepID=UPI00119D44B8|nr:helix-turn-helix transcriptional regulator [Lysinibacillus fusiformis]